MVEWIEDSWIPISIPKNQWRETKHQETGHKENELVVFTEVLIFRIQPKLERIVYVFFYFSLNVFLHQCLL